MAAEGKCFHLEESGINLPRIVTNFDNIRCEGCFQDHGRRRRQCWSSVWFKSSNAIFSASARLIYKFEFLCCPNAKANFMLKTSLNPRSLIQRLLIRIDFAHHVLDNSWKHNYWHRMLQWSPNSQLSFEQHLNCGVTWDASLPGDKWNSNYEGTLNKDPVRGFLGSMIWRECAWVQAIDEGGT